MSVCEYSEDFTEPVSETPIGEEEDKRIRRLDQDADVVLEAAAFTLLKEQLVEVLGTLTEREQKVLCLRFGLEDEVPVHLRKSAKNLT